jgi:hypothetical protein
MGCQAASGRWNAQTGQDAGRQHLRKRGVRAAAEDADDKACRTAAARQQLSPPASKMCTAGSDKATSRAGEAAFYVTSRAAAGQLLALA